jgi:hypothetical protein
MGSIEVYDYEQMKWVPYKDDPDKWYQHFKDLGDGYVKADHKGRYIVGSGHLRKRVETLEAKLKATEEKLKLAEEELKNTQRPSVNLVSPVAQAIEIAKSEVKWNRNSSIPERKKRRTDNDWSHLTY